MSNQDKSREAFEAYFLRTLYPNGNKNAKRKMLSGKNSSGEYNHQNVAPLWTTWQAARADLEAENARLREENRVLKVNLRTLEEISECEFDRSYDGEN